MKVTFKTSLTARRDTGSEHNSEIALIQRCLLEYRVLVDRGIWISRVPQPCFLCLQFMTLPSCEAANGEKAQGLPEAGEFRSPAMTDDSLDEIMSHQGGELDAY